MLSLMVVLAGCGNGRKDIAAQACNSEIGHRLAGKSYVLDVDDLAAHATSERPDTLLLTSTAVFDPGLSTEYKQTYECRVRFDKGGKPSVLYLQFNWNTADLKESR